MPKKTGTSAVDIMAGGSGMDHFFGLKGNDRLKGYGGNDYLVGGYGNDLLDGGDGNDILFGFNETLLDARTGKPRVSPDTEATTDFLWNNSNHLIGGKGDDILIGAGKIEGGAGNDVIVGGDVWSDGGAGNDIIINSSANGGIGNDTYIVTEAGSYLPTGPDLGKDRFIVSGNFSGDVNLGSLGKEDILEFKSVKGIKSVKDVDARMEVSGGFVSIYVDSDTTVKYTWSGWAFGDAGPKIVIDKTDVTGIFKSINARIGEAMNTKFVNLTSKADSHQGGSNRDVIDGKGGNDTLRGGAGNDVIDGGKGNDRLHGDKGNDTLTGGLGADRLYGGAGADRFIFNSVKDSTVAAAGRDKIYDFSSKQKDKVDLGAIDANTKAGGNQAFKFIGTEKFHKKAGELRYEKKGGDTYIYGDVNGDGKADFSIRFDASLNLKASDFIL